ncbi:hypothetical protein FNYG_14935 [Fusarium nygamai]|uniref:Uncharacterized protein n=1 Tax=Gibberella nygamai TaxID=42673 RepID=A0A2K0UNJ0_GIBNY|nr:hypothetical protein FNYG_14935 [Fusarium nygamai]
MYWWSASLKHPDIHMISLAFLEIHLVDILTYCNIVQPEENSAYSVL